ncbi:MAG: RNA polymerase sigma-70 factor [Tannerella sp.]|jgi:RNA polymerase sigma-70 factor (ECF subfamily)|nr:RNA polymerase sigma-70 factor [Tannerella sp.]
MRGRGDDLKYTDSLQDNFERIYSVWYLRLVHFAKEYVMSLQDAENIVQDVFLLLWEKRRVLNIQVGLSVYLFSIVKKKCIDFLRNKTAETNYLKELSYKLQALEQFDHDFTSDEDIERILNEAINKLPPRCRNVFVKCRIEGKSYDETASELNISVSTVGNQMSIAIHKLRLKLKLYL